MNRSHIFLRCYRATGSVTKAALAARIDRSIHYERLKKDAAYRAAFERAKEVAIAVLEDEALRRAVDGIDEPVTYQGRISYEPLLDIDGKPVLDADGQPIPRPITIRRYSDSLLQFLLRGAKPEKYRERHQHDINANVTVTKFKGSFEDLLKTYRDLTQETDSQAA